MRVAIAIAIGTLALSSGHGHVLAQTHAGETPALESIHMIDALTGWAVTLGANALVRTVDGGIRWKNVTPHNASGEQLQIGAVAVLTSLIAWGVAATNIYHTADGGQTWKETTIPAGTGMISFVSPQEGWFHAPLGSYTGRTEADIYRSTDGGETWIKVASNTTASSGLTNLSGVTGMAFRDSQTGWITGLSVFSDWFYLYVTHDGGRTWRHEKLPVLPQLTPHWGSVIVRPTFFTAQDGILPVFFHVLDEESRDTVSALGIFYVTQNGGATWTYTIPVPFEPGNEHVSDFADMVHGWVTDGDALYATSNGGRVWTKIQPPSPFVDVKQLDFVSRQIGWAVSRAYPWLLKTVDAGRTWAAVPYAIERP